MPLLRDRRNTDINNLGLNVSAGSFRGISTIHTFGHNNNVDATFETIWLAGGLYVYPPSATTMTLSSNDTNDFATGTGAQTIRIHGLDSNYDEITEDITLHASDGLLSVTTVNSYLRVWGMIVLTAGSAEAAVGMIYMGTGTITLGIPAVIHGSISPDHNRTTQAFYTIPAGKTGFLLKMHASIDASKTAELHFMIRTLGGVFSSKLGIHLFDAPYIYDLAIPFRIEEKSDIEVRGAVPQTAAALYAGFELILVDNDLLPT